MDRIESGMSGVSWRGLNLRAPQRLMTSPRWRRWSHNAQPSPDPARDRARALCLCDAAFRQSRARQHFDWRDGERPRDPEADLAIAAGRDDPLRFASDPYEPRLLGALRAAPIPLDSTRGDPARPRPLHSIPADQSRDRHPRRAEPIWDREGICAGTREFLGQFALARRAASGSVADRLDSRLPRHPFLAAAQAVLPAREGPAAFDRGASARAGAARLLPGRRADLSGGSGPRMAGAHSVSRARRRLRLRTRFFWTSARGRSLSWLWRWPPRSPPGPSDNGESTGSARSG